MMTDGSLSFVPLGSPLSLVGAANQTFASNVLDLLGAGVGQAPPGIIGNVSVYGSPDAKGIGKERPEINCVMGAALIAVGGATLNAALQAAIDTGAGGGYQPGAWQNIASEDGMTAAQLVASTVFLRFPFLPPFPANLRPRFVRILFSPSTGGSFTQGTVASALVTTMRDDYSIKYAANNYKVA